MLGIAGCSLWWERGVCRCRHQQVRPLTSGLLLFVVRLPTVEAVFGKADRTTAQPGSFAKLQDGSFSFEAVVLLTAVHQRSGVAAVCCKPGLPAVLEDFFLIAGGACSRPVCATFKLAKQGHQSQKLANFGRQLTARDCKVSHKAQTCQTLWLLV